jgi:hypothetical protein
MKSFFQMMAIVAAVVAAVVLVAILIPRRPSVPPAPPASLYPPLENGTVAKLIGAGSGVWIAFGDVSNLNELIDAQASETSGRPHAGAQLYRLAEERRVRIYDRGQRVRVIDSKGGACRVLLLDGPERGTKGWVQREFVSPE